jgi:ornithine cyclodeaminase/alanine dehydrogenase-like protein (mu-crystallin family)
VALVLNHARHYQNIIGCAAQAAAHLAAHYFVRVLDGIRGVHRTGAANRAADLRAIERFVDDLADCAGATPTLGAAAEATINMACGSTRGIIRGGSHLVIAQHVAGADDHRTPLSGIR